MLPPLTHTQSKNTQQWSRQTSQPMYAHAPALSMYLLAPVALLVLLVLIVTFLHTPGAMRQISADGRNRSVHTVILHRQMHRVGSLF